VIGPGVERRWGLFIGPCPSVAVEVAFEGTVQPEGLGMRDATFVPAKINQLDRDIAQAERLISEKVQSIILAGQNGRNTAEAKGHAREMRRALEHLYAQRRKAIRAANLPKAR
jgi:hypothetical protein